MLAWLNDRCSVRKAIDSAQNDHATLVQSMLANKDCPIFTLCHRMTLILVLQRMHPGVQRVWGAVLFLQDEQ